MVLAVRVAEPPVLRPPFSVMLPAERVPAPADCMFPVSPMDELPVNETEVPAEIVPPLIVIELPVKLPAAPL